MNEHTCGCTHTHTHAHTYTHTGVPDKSTLSCEYSINSEGKRVIRIKIYYHGSQNDEATISIDINTLQLSSHPTLSDLAPSSLFLLSFPLHCFFPQFSGSFNLSL